jgi:Family of unknown function (DUF6384)
MVNAVSSVAVEAAAAAPGTLDDMMLAMDVVDTLRHRERLVERELNEDVREEQLIERLRALYKSQGIEVPDNVLAEGVKALKEDRFVYTPPRPSFGRTLATLWVKRTSYGKWVAAALVALALAVGLYQFTVVKPRESAAEAAKTELSETLPRDLAAAHTAVVAEARVPIARERADAILAQGRAALERGNAVDARSALGELDQLSKVLQQEFVLRIAGRPEDETGFFREHPSFQGRAYFIVVDAVDSKGDPVRLSIHNDETNKTETVSRFAVRVPIATFDAVRDDKATNGVVQNARMAEKRRGYLDPEFLMPTLQGRITSW